MAYTTQEEVTKKIKRHLVASINEGYIEELHNEFTRFTNQTPKSILAHLVKEFCKATISNKLQAEVEFCAETCEFIDNRWVALKITGNAMWCPIFTQLDHEVHTDLDDHKLAMVKALWIEKYKAHTKYTRNQEGNNKYESAALTIQPPIEVTLVGNEYNTYVLALKDFITRQVADRKEALAVSNRATPTNTPTFAELMAEMKKEITMMVTTAMAVATINSGSSTTSVEGTGADCSGGHYMRNTAYGKNKNGEDLPKYPRCNRPAKHNPGNCFKNAEKMKMANFVNEKFVKKAE